MAFTFLHTADWQIGKTFGRFPDDVAVLLRARRLDTIDRIAELARESGAGHILVAGDVIDSELIDDASLRQPLGRMSVHRDLVWHLLPGNHDPARPGGIWERIAGLGLPANVKTCLAPVALEMAPGVVLLPAPLFARETSADPTEWMDRVATPEGAVRIGMAHGSVRGFGSLGEAAVPIDAGRRQSAGLDYLALGDWHGAKEIAPGVWYSGTPEPDSFADNGPGHTLVVRVQAAGATPEVTKVPTAQTRWVERRVALARLADIEPVEHEISTLGAAQRSTVLAMRLEGAIAASEAGHLDERIARLRAGLLALDIDRRRLRVMVGSGDVAQIDDAVLSLVAGRLAGSAANSETPEGRIAARAMRILLALAAPGPGGEGRA